METPKIFLLLNARITQGQKGRTHYAGLNSNSTRYASESAISQSSL